ncbi:nuclear receptor-interacting protein 3-like [Heptranchias perlo]|uniref:nuclear receptor-interacting protein 3-like n=1 Tax=Heptranchias perlo TaxID=212740 RepID=UPI00355A360C
MFYSDILRESRRQQMDIREAASLRQQRRMKQAVQFIHKDSADLLPLDGLKKLGTSKETQPHNILQRRLLETNLSKFRANNRGTWPSNNSFPVQNKSFHQTKQELHKRTHEDDLIFVCCKCAGIEMKVRIDTGSRYNLISSACVDKLGLKELVKINKDETEKMGMPFISKVIGQIENIAITIGQVNIECSAAVVDDDEKTLSFGLQTLRSLKCIIDMEKQYLILGEKEKEEIPFLGIDSTLNEDCRARPMQNWDAGSKIENVLYPSTDISNHATDPCYGMNPLILAAIPIPHLSGMCTSCVSLENEVGKFLRGSISLPPLPHGKMSETWLH